MKQSLGLVMLFLDLVVMGYVLVTRGKTGLVLASGIGLCETDVVDGCGGLGETDGVKEIL